MCVCADSVRVLPMSKYLFQFCNVNIIFCAREICVADFYYYMRDVMGGKQYLGKWKTNLFTPFNIFRVFACLWRLLDFYDDDYYCDYRYSLFVFRKVCSRDSTWKFSFWWIFGENLLIRFKRPDFTLYNTKMRVHPSFYLTVFHLSIWLLEQAKIFYYKNVKKLQKHDELLFYHNIHSNSGVQKGRQFI